MAYKRDDIPSLFNKEEYRNVQPSQYALLLGLDPIRCKRKKKKKKKAGTFTSSCL